MTNKNKKLTLSNINKLNSKLNERRAVRVCGDYEVEIDINFRKTKINRVILDYFTVLQDLKRNPDVTDETITGTISLINALVVKHFSNCPIPDINNIEKLIQVSNALLDLGIMDELFGDNGFAKDQVDLLGKQIEKVGTQLGEVYGELAIKSAINSMDVEEDEEAVQ